MRQKNCILIALIVAIFGACLTACSGDNDDNGSSFDPSKPIVGKWFTYLDYTDKGVKADEYYQFWTFNNDNTFECKTRRQYDRYAIANGTYFLEKTGETEYRLEIDYLEKHYSMEGEEISQDHFEDTYYISFNTDYSQMKLMGETFKRQ